MISSTYIPTLQNTKGFSLRDLVGPLFRRKAVGLIVFTSVLVLTITTGLLLPPPFKSHMAVLVDRERQDPLVTTQSTTQLPSNTASEVTVEEINSEAELLLSQDLLARVVVVTGLNNRHSVLDFLFPAKDDQQRVERAVKKLARKIKVKNETNSNLIDVSYISDDPQLSYSVLSALGTYYVEKHATVHRPPGSFQFFAKQTTNYSEALKVSEARLKNFSQSQGVAAPDVVRTDLAQQVSIAIGQVYASQQAAAADEERIRSDTAQMRATPPRSDTQRASAPPDKLLESLGTSLLAAQTKRTQLVLKYDSTYPLVREADQEITQASAAIAEAEKTRYISQTTDVDPTYELLREDLARTNSDLSAQHATEIAARHSIEGIRKEMVDLNQKALVLQDLQRDAKANEDNYLLYLAKREQERTSDALDQTRIGNVAIAVPPSIPVLPLYSTPMVILLAFAAALLLGSGTAYAADYLDSSFHTPAQVVDTLGIPVVISMPRKRA